MVERREIYITEHDLQRLEGIANSGHSPNLELLREELSRAMVVKSEDVPPDLVTMNSRVKFTDLETGEESEITLVFPRSADVSAGKVSILAPVGAALLGLSVGDNIDWPVPSGKTRKLRVTAVLYQPEAEGKFD
ncbi:MAG: nucleoside diphosphate kinase regulator [Deltaproteobacteria bacterium]|nr:nucleoside diphosphate kinase regulator [Deltaproteobacteria bacterium]